MCTCMLHIFKSILHEHMYSILHELIACSTKHTTDGVEYGRGNISIPAWKILTREFFTVPHIRMAQ